MPGHLIGADVSRPVAQYEEALQNLPRTFSAAFANTWPRVGADRLSSLFTRCSILTYASCALTLLLFDTAGLLKATKIPTARHVNLASVS
jgi:hypothetical protein